MPKSFLIILIIVFLITAGLVLYFFLMPENDSNEALLIINYGETKRVFLGEVREGMTIFDALLVSAKAGNFDFSFEGDKLKRIDQLEENSKKWNVYLNGIRIENSLDEVFIKAQDEIELRFE